MSVVDCHSIHRIFCSPLHWKECDSLEKRMKFIATNFIGRPIVKTKDFTFCVINGIILGTKNITIMFYKVIKAICLAPFIIVGKISKIAYRVIKYIFLGILNGMTKISDWTIVPVVNFLIISPVAKAMSYIKGMLSSVISEAPFDDKNLDFEAFANTSDSSFFSAEDSSTLESIEEDNSFPLKIEIEKEEMKKALIKLASCHTKTEYSKPLQDPEFGKLPEREVKEKSKLPKAISREKMLEAFKQNPYNQPKDKYVKLLSTPQYQELPKDLQGQNVDELVASIEGNQINLVDEKENIPIEEEEVEDISKIFVPKIEAAFRDQIKSSKHVTYVKPLLDPISEVLPKDIESQSQEAIMVSFDEGYMGPSIKNSQVDEEDQCKVELTDAQDENHNEEMNSSESDDK